MTPARVARKTTTARLPVMGPPLVPEGGTLSQPVRACAASARLTLAAFALPDHWDRPACRHDMCRRDAPPCFAVAWAQWVRPHRDFGVGTGLPRPSFRGRPRSAVQSTVCEGVGPSLCQGTRMPNARPFDERCPSPMGLSERSRGSAVSPHGLRSACPAVRPKDAGQPCAGCRGWSDAVHPQARRGGE